MLRDSAATAAMLERLHQHGRARVVPETSKAFNAAVHSRSTEANEEPEGLRALTTLPCGSAGSTCFASTSPRSKPSLLYFAF
jgi:hypothetical protein